MAENRAENKPKLTEREMAEKFKKAYKMQMENGIDPAFSDDITEELNRIKNIVNLYLECLIKSSLPKNIIELDFEIIRSGIDDFEKLIYENRKPTKSEIGNK